LSSAFIRSADYGTRSSTLMWVDQHQKVKFDEWRWDAAGALGGRTSETFVLSPEQR
jgi:uncharacterized protein with NRDE domain